jgi:hypothetical protein
MVLRTCRWILRDCSQILFPLRWRHRIRVGKFSCSNNAAGGFSAASRACLLAAYCSLQRCRRNAAGENAAALCRASCRAASRIPTIVLAVRLIGKQDNGKKPIDIVGEAVRVALLASLTPVQNVLYVPPPKISVPLCGCHPNPPSHPGRQWQRE